MELYEPIIQQLKDYCDCLKDKDLKDTDKFAKNVEQLINLISTLTCWKRGDEVCETFLMQTRVEYIDVSLISRCCRCDNGIMNTELFYDLVQPDSIKLQLKIRDGIHIKYIDIDNSHFEYDVTTNELWIDLSDYLLTGECSCEKVEKIIVTYDAGFEQIPECLLPVFCDYLQYVIEMNRCECSTCDTCNSTEDYEDAEKDLIVNLDNTDEQLNTYIAVRRSIVKTYARQLEIISLCGRHRRFLGMVV